MTHSNYTLACVERAVTFMSDETRSGRTPSLDETAQAAGLSKYHFNRLYRLATGETSQETLTRFRLAQATDRLKDPETSVTDAAFSAGYGSSQSFAKALKRVLSTSASAIRQDEERLGAAIETLAAPAQSEDADRAGLSVEIARLDPFEAVARRTDGAYPELNTTYWSLFEAVGDPQNVAAILGRPFGDIDQADTLHFDCALKVSQAPDALPVGFSRVRIDGGVYLITRHVGSYDGLSEAMDRLYLGALSNDAIRLSDAPALFHYLDDPETTAEAELRTDLYLQLNV
ncbi:MAG: GyrI-like domain-containing protein [Pseudomonadota bacterium]